MILVFLHWSCEKFLEEEPKSFAAAENLFNSKSGIEQTLMGIYDAGREFYIGRYYVMMFGTSTDEVSYVFSNASRLELQNFTFSAVNSNLEYCWRCYAYGISRANLVLDYLPADFADQDFINRVQSETRFLRAWYYFGLVRVYGAVPLLNSYIDVEMFPANSTIPEIYTQIIEDLRGAEQNLPGWQEIAVHERGRITRGAAKSLLALVYLTRASTEASETSDFSNAASKAKEVIDTEGYGLWENYNDVFLSSSENGKEDIFSYQCLAETRFASSFHADYSPNPDIFGQAGYGNFCLTDLLYNSFEADDERSELVLKGDYHVEGSTQVYTTPKNQAYTQKFRDPEHKNRNSHGTNMPFIRYSDVLLMYAEASNEVSTTPPADALAALNAVRVRANIAPLNGLSKEQFRQAVRDERFKEFYGESIRWFDLVRWGILKERVELAKAGVTVQWPKHRYFPIPQKEIDANPNLIQNEGY